MAKRSPRAIKRDFKALGQLVKESSAQVAFSSILTIAGNNIERNRSNKLIVHDSKDGATGRIWGFLIMGRSI